jgi:hypothetical protein
VRRVLALTALASLAVLAAGAGRAGATTECRGLKACVPVAGPWVVVTASQRAPRPQVEYQLSCPKGYIVAGVDAELTNSAIDLWFLGESGSPIGPGTTTHRDLVFVATYVGSASQSPTFRPHIGCIPTSGGGARIRTSVQAVVPPGRPAIRHVRTVRATAGGSYSVSCARDERLVSGYSTGAFRGNRPPQSSAVSALSVRTTFAGNHVTARVRRGAGNALVQVAAVCVGGA